MQLLPERMLALLLPILLLTLGIVLAESKVSHPNSVLSAVRQSQFLLQLGIALVVKQISLLNSVLNVVQRNPKNPLLGLALTVALLE
jgi:hypothetical protein